MEEVAAGLLGILSGCVITQIFINIHKKKKDGKQSRLE